MNLCEKVEGWKQGKDDGDGIKSVITYKMSTTLIELKFRNLFNT